VPEGQVAEGPRIGTTEPSAAAGEDLGLRDRVTSESPSPRSIARPGHPDPLAPPELQAIQQNPHLEIPGEDGKPVNAAHTLAEATEATAQGEKEIPDAVTAAINCFQRKGPE
jgi:hypothetical protein